LTPPSLRSARNVLAVDTNVLVRLLIDDPGAAKQCAWARKLASDAGTVSVSQVVQMETVWALESVYGFQRADIASALDAMQNNQSFVLQEAGAFRAALAAFHGGNADFADYLILMHARADGAELVTFDRKLGKFDGARLLVA
jgi:predicted nucleic-acid-binding protein